MNTQPLFCTQHGHGYEYGSLTLLTIRWMLARPRFCYAADLMPLSADAIAATVSAATMPPFRFYAMMPAAACLRAAAMLFMPCQVIYIASRHAAAAITMPLPLRHYAAMPMLADTSPLRRRC